MDPHQSNHDHRCSLRAANRCRAAPRLRDVVSRRRLGRVAGRNLIDEVEACHGHAFARVKAVRILSLHPRIQVHLLATLPCSLSLEPGKQPGTMALRALLGQSDQVVDVQETPPGQVFSKPKSGNGNDAVRCANVGQPIPRMFLTPNPGDELLLHEVRTKLPHDGKTGGNLAVGRGDANVHGGLHGISIGERKGIGRQDARSCPSRAGFLAGRSDGKSHGPVRTP